MCCWHVFLHIFRMDKYLRILINYKDVSAGKTGKKTQLSYFVTPDIPGPGLPVGKTRPGPRLSTRYVRCFKDRSLASSSSCNRRSSCMIVSCSAWQKVSRAKVKDICAWNCRASASRPSTHQQ
ncbi:Uncharacterised protein [Acinetobacter baumannii]|nr:Uncharacterised protein [Acinetobacter baumannii]